MMALAPPLQYLALGDSYTIGEAVAATERWPAVLVEQLRQSGMTVDDPRIVAVTGWTTDELAQGMDDAALTPGYDLVTLQIGVNNQYRGRGIDEYREQFGGLLMRAIALAGSRPARVVAVSIPDWGVTRFARERACDPTSIAAALDAFNAVAREQAERAGAQFVDITPISRRRPELLAADGLHPCARQYTLWVKAIVPAVRAALS